MKLKRGDIRFAILALSPMLAPVFFISLYPIAQAFVVSFEAYDISKPLTHTPFIGFTNYVTVFNSFDLQQSVISTLIFTGASLALVLGIAFGTAMLLSQKFRGVKFFQILFLVPWGVPYIVAGALWAWILNAQFGVLNGIFTQLGLITDYQAWLVSPTFAQLFLIIAYVWSEAPLTILLILAGIQSMPQELYEAALIDGASAWVRFRKITFTWLRPVLQIVFIYETLSALRVFDLVFALTQGGPFDTTSLISFFTYRVAFVFGEFGQGSALSVIIVGVSVVLAVAYLRLIKIPKLT